MYAITASIRKSRIKGKPGVIIFKVRDPNNAMRMITSGIQSTEEQLTTTHRHTVLQGLKRIYDIAEKLYDSGTPHTIDDIADTFIDSYGDTPVRSNISGFKIRREVASVGKPFNRWVKTIRSCKEKDFDGNRLTVQSLTGYITDLVINQSSTFRAGTLNNYKSTRNALAKFINILPEDSTEINSDFILRFNRWLKANNLAESTVSFYMRILRMILNKANEQGLVDIKSNWFKGMVSLHEPVQKNLCKNILSKEILNKIANVNLESDPQIDFARDIFMFSFYCRGIELFDIMHLSHKNISGGKIVYNKRLTGKLQEVKLEPQAKRIIDKYMREDKPVIFLATGNFTTSNVYHTIRKVITDNLGRLGKLLNISTPMTFSMARNTWQHLANECNISSLMIS